jgi:hypothetical protein
MSTPIINELDLWNAFCDEVSELEIFAVPWSMESCRGRVAMQRRVDDLNAAWAAVVAASPCEDGEQ